MKSLARLLRFICTPALAVLVLFDNAWAYIDPATGSYVIQIILAGVLGALFALKTYWGRIKLFFTRKKKDASQDTD